MSGPFRVGDVCVGVGFTRHTDRTGMECVIEGPLKWGAHRCTVYGDKLPPSATHLVRWADGLVTNVRPVKLRLRRPPSWDKWLYSRDNIDDVDRLDALHDANRERHLKERV